MERFDYSERTEKLVGIENVLSLQNRHVAVFGLGGVGGYVCEMLARAGIGELSICDFDKVSLSNLNRQIIATRKTIGKFKTEVMKARLLEINPNLKINVLNFEFNKQTKEQIDFSKFDYIADAIDSVENKLELILTAKQNKTKIISAMGSGNKFGIPCFEVKDIYKTTNDGLAKKMRKLLRENGVESLEVCIANEKSLSITNGVASISYYPAMAGCVVSAKIINTFLEI